MLKIFDKIDQKEAFKIAPENFNQMVANLCDQSKGQKAKKLRKDNACKDNINHTNWDDAYSASSSFS